MFQWWKEQGIEKVRWARKQSKEGRGGGTGEMLAAAWWAGEKSNGDLSRDNQEHDTVGECG